MQRNFATLDALANHFDAMARKVPDAIRAGLDETGARVQNAARNKLGSYQIAAGQFQAWQDLAKATQRERIKAGYPGDEPLLVTGTLERSIEYQVVGNAVHVGSDDPIADYQERGTNRIPPRSFLGSTLFEMAPTLSKQMLARIGKLLASVL